MYAENATAETIMNAIIPRTIRRAEPLRFIGAPPSIRLLAKELCISVITTKRAYDELEREGFIYTQPGRGSFVAPRNPELHREEALKRVEDLLAQAVEAARVGGITEAELRETLELLLEA